MAPRPMLFIAIAIPGISIVVALVGDILNSLYEYAMACVAW